MRKEKTRIDELLVTRGLAENIKESQAFIMSGYIMAGEEKITKPGAMVSIDTEIRFTRDFSRYASRGALKLDGALTKFGINPQNRICIDVGSSTGGFTDILLQKGAEKVFAFDVGYGQMISRLASDPRVIVRDKFNIKNITPQDIDFHNNILVVIDVSFISLKSVLPAISALKTSTSEVEVLALLKPQFEARESELEKGIVKDSLAHFRIIKSVLKEIKYKLHGKLLGLIRSPIQGKDGNTEFFIWCRF